MEVKLDVSGDKCSQPLQIQIAVFLQVPIIVQLSEVTKGQRVTIQITQLKVLI